MRPHLTWLALALTAVPALAADICKVTDDKGRVHYSNVAPVGRQCQEIITVVHPDPDEIRRANERREKQLQQTKELGNSREKARVADEERAKEQEERMRRCEDAKAEMKFLEEAYGMRLVRPRKEGEPEEFQWLDDKEKDKLIESWRQQVDDWCGSQPPSSAGETPERVYGAPPPIRRKPAAPMPPKSNKP